MASILARSRPILATAKFRTPRLHRADARPVQGVLSRLITRTRISSDREGCRVGVAQLAPRGHASEEHSNYCQYHRPVWREGSCDWDRSYWAGGHIIITGTSMTMALEIVRVPLQKFERSLNDKQRARLSALVASENVTPVCAKNPEPANWPMPILKQALQFTAAQEAALNNLERAFDRAAGGLNAVCSDGMPRMPSARLQAIEARLDITWVAVQTIQVAVAQFQKQLSDQQRARLTPFRLPQPRTGARGLFEALRDRVAVGGDHNDRRISDGLGLAHLA